MRHPGLHAITRSVFAGLFAAVIVTSADGATNELSNAADVRSLSPEQAQQQIPVHLRAVVTFFSEGLFSYFVQDSTAGIYLHFTGESPVPHLEPGQTVDVTGTASPGEYAPVVKVDSVTVSGRAELPEARKVTYEQLAAGGEDSQFVEISGIVRAVQKSESSGFYEIEVATGGGRLRVFAQDLPVENPDELPDSIVRVRGVCSTKFTHQRQLFAIGLMVPRREDVMVRNPAPKDPFQTPIRPIGSLLQFTPQVNYGHRVKVTGTVTYFARGSLLYLQDNERGVLAETSGTEPLGVGDVVEVLGFVSQGDYAPMLQDAVYRKVTTGVPPASVRVTTDEALTGNFDCQLIQVPALVIDRSRHADEDSLLLQDGNVIFRANLRVKERGDSFERIANGSLVSVAGVCRIEPGGWSPGADWRAKGFSVLLRSPADVSVLKMAPWWTMRKVLWFAGALAVAALAAFGWVVVLRKQVAERTRALQAQTQQTQLAERRREIEQERARLAHDLHDDLGAGITEVNMLASLVKSDATLPDEKMRYLDDIGDSARRMVTSLDEIVWAVNPRNDTIASLASYFSSYAERFLEIASVSCGLDIMEDLPDVPLDPKFRQEIFFAFKEALTNVARHAQATQVWLRIAVREQMLVIEVADNGRGFPPENLRAGGDGVANMNQRLKALGGACSVTSDTSTGTTVRMSAPLPENSNDQSWHR